MTRSGACLRAGTGVRRSVAKIVAGALLGLCLVAVTGCEERAIPTNPDLPNVVFITADDLGWFDLGSYGNPNVRTPHLDRLAREGVRFTHAFVTASSCSSSRATLITGQYPHTNGVTGLTHAHPLLGMRPFRDTMPSLLRDAGLRTALEGKWHVSPFLPTSWFGYDERLSGMFSQDMWITDSARSVEFLRRNRDRPFYFEINYMNTHRDDEGDFEFAEGFPIDPERIRVPAYLHLPDWPEIRRELARFYSQAEAMDAMIGDVLSALDDLGLANDTLVVFVSDNGPPFPGSKMTLYDRGVGTPLLMRWPARLPAGRTVDALVSTVDLLPTVLEAMGRPIPAWVQGRALLGLATGEADEPLHDAVFMEMTYHIDHIPMRAVRTRRWKYIRNLTGAPVGLDQLDDEDWAHRLCELPDQPWKRPRPPEELYDLADDPHEQRNLAGNSAHAAIRRELAEMLRED